jgi:hypothetical protein
VLVKAKRGVTFDTILGISGVAVGVAALIPMYVVKGVRGWIATAVVSVFLVLMSIAILYQRHAEGREIDRLENEIRRMFSGNNPQTFEEIYDGLHYAPYDLVVKAIDEQIDSDKIWAGRMDVKSPSGTMYVVRVYNNINFPVPPRRFAPESTEHVDAPKVCPATLPQYVSRGWMAVIHKRKCVNRRSTLTLSSIQAAISRGAGRKAIIKTFSDT